MTLAATAARLHGKRCKRIRHLLPCLREDLDEMASVLGVACDSGPGRDASPYARPIRDRDRACRRGGSRRFC